MEPTAAAVINSAIEELELQEDATSPDHLEGFQKRKEEPTPEDLESELDMDFSDLDDLIAESVAATKRAYRSPRDVIRAVAASCIPAAEVWTVVENIAIWERTTCKCGIVNKAIFLHYKEKRVSGRTTIWKQVDTIDSAIKTRQALKSREAVACEHCLLMPADKMEDIANVF